MKSHLMIISVAISLLVHFVTNHRLYGIQAGFGDNRRHTLFMNRIGQCEGFENLPSFVQDCRIVQLNTTHYVVGGNLIFRKSYAENIEGSVRVEQCNATGYCQPFTSTISFGDACGFLKKIDPALVFVKQRIKPAFECPFREGVYRFEDVITDNMVFRYLSPHVSNDWRIVITAVHQGHMIFCLSIELGVFGWEEMLVKTKYH